MLWRKDPQKGQHGLDQPKKAANQQGLKRHSWSDADMGAEPYNKWKSRLGHERDRVVSWVQILIMAAAVGQAWHTGPAGQDMIQPALGSRDTRLKLRQRPLPISCYGSADAQGPKSHELIAAAGGRRLARAHAALTNPHHCRS